MRSLRRSVLSVPGSNEKMISKAVGLPADEIMLDLEDGVAPEEKERARLKVIRAFKERDWADRIRAFRINALDTPFAYGDIIDIVEQAGASLDVIVIPKVEKAVDVQFVDLLLTQIELKLGRREPIGLEASVETALGMLNIKEIAFASPRLETLVFGIADYGASLTMPSSSISGHGEAEEQYPGHRWHFPMSRMVMAAKALGASNSRVIFNHILPNTVSIIVTFIPFSIANGIIALTSLDYLGFGLPAPTPSWGELLAQGSNNLESIWIVSSVIIAMTIILVMVTFIGEAVREAFDPKKHTTYE